MKIVQKKIEDIQPYEKNPRKNDDAVKYVANSIKEFGFKVPIVIDKDGIIVAGHTRYKASQKLGLKEVPCIVADDLTEEQIKAYRLADNKVSEQSKWDNDLLVEELSDILEIDMEDFGFLSGIDEEEENPYTMKTDIPQYEIKGEEPELSDLVEEYKVQEFSDDKEMQELMEKSALVIIDIDNAIANGYAKLSGELEALFEDEEE